MKLREIVLTPPIVALIISFGLMFDASAADRYVSADKDYGSGPNGEVMEGDLLYDTIQGAITAAKAGETVWVKDGFVCETGGTSTKKNGFVCRVVIDKAITLRSQSGEGRSGNPPIIRGAWANPDATCMDEAVGTGLRRPLYVSAAATVLGFIIERGAAHTLNSDYSDYGGGGISGKLGSIEKCVIRNCYSGYGGGVHGSASSSNERLTLVDCVISNNFVQYRGDGAWGALTLKNCLVAGNGGDPNTAKKKGSGGVSGKSDTFRIWVEGCVISNNTTVGSGGGATWAKISKGSRIVGNIASASGGGAIDSALVDSEICLNKVTGTHSATSAGGGLISCVATNCVITGNTAQIGGGVSGGTTVNCYLANNRGRSAGGGVSLTSTANLCVGCTVVSNTAGGWGGGLYATVEKASFYNCLVAWNEQGENDGIGASGACGLASSSVRVRLVNCTVVSNRLNSGTNSRAGVSQCVLINTIVWDNLNANGKPSDLNMKAACSAVNSCAPELTDTTKYPGCTAADPKFRRGCVYQIGPRSPCRETGLMLTDDAVFSSMEKDIDGNPRFGEKDGEPTIDMGCCQYVPFGLMMMVK